MGERGKIWPLARGKERRKAFCVEWYFRKKKKSGHTDFERKKESLNNKKEKRCP